MVDLLKVENAASNCKIYERPPVCRRLLASILHTTKLNCAFFFDKLHAINYAIYISEILRSDSHPYGLFFSISVGPAVYWLCAEFIGVQVCHKNGDVFRGAALILKNLFECAEMDVKME